MGLVNIYLSENGPAVIRPDGTKIWYNHGKIHRIDGPAIIYSDGIFAYFIEDRQCLRSNFEYLASIWIVNQVLNT